MKIPKTTDEELIHCFEQYRIKSDSSRLREVSSLWVIQNATRRFKLEEDDISEIYLDYITRFQNCLEIFNEKNHTNFILFLSLVTKHIVLTILRRKKPVYPEEYFSMWNQLCAADYDNPLLPGITYTNLYDSMKCLNPFGRIIICLKFNLILNKEEKDHFEWYLGKIGTNIEEFYINHEKRIYDKVIARNIILQQINSCNRKIFLSKKSNLKFHQRKKVLITNFSNTYKLYSSNEIAKILKIKSNKVNYYFNQSLIALKNILKFEGYDREKAKIAA